MIERLEGFAPKKKSPNVGLSIINVFNLLILLMFVRFYHMNNPSFWNSLKLTIRLV